MILTNRLFERSEPTRDAKSVYIFSEGAKREVQYFLYFRGIDSRINIEIYPLDPQENNSPVGLYNIACECIVKTHENPNPKYEFINGIDEVWFVIDIDRWGEQIGELQKECNRHNDWNVAQSNPCFEVWLYFHLYSDKAQFEGIERCTNWKVFLNQQVRGGFDSRRHPIFIKEAIENAKSNFKNSNNAPSVGCSDVFKLGQTIYPLIENKINVVRNNLSNKSNSQIDLLL